MTPRTIQRTQNKQQLPAVVTRCSAAVLCALRVAGIVVGVVMGRNRCIGVVKGVRGDRKCPMARGTNCEVEYRVDEDWRLLDDSEGSLRVFLTDKMTEMKPENLEMIDRSQPVVVFVEIQVPSKYMRPL